MRYTFKILWWVKKNGPKLYRRPEVGDHPSQRQEHFQVTESLSTLFQSYQQGISDLDICRFQYWSTTSTGRCISWALQGTKKGLDIKDDAQRGPLSEINGWCRGVSRPTWSFRKVISFISDQRLIGHYYTMITYERMKKDVTVVFYRSKCKLFTRNGWMDYLMSLVMMHCQGNRPGHSCGLISGEKWDDA